MKHQTRLKNMLLLCAILLSGILGMTQTVYAQSVSGTVTSAEDGEPLPGVNVQIKGTTQGTITDASGKYNLQVPNLNGTLRFSFIGFETKEVSINGKTTLNVELKVESQTIGTVVKIGYQTVKEEDVTGAISVVSEKELTRTPASTFGQAIQGKATGVLVTQSGSPGGGVDMKIRGIGSITQRTNPLYVIDGVVGGDINSIAPEDIKSISILKDASSAAIYGANAANGVVLVETKRGKSGKTNVSFTSYFGINRSPAKFDLMNADEYADFYTDILTANNETPDMAYSDHFRQTYYGEGWEEGTDWQEEILQESFTQNYYLRVSGGAENSNYSISANYYDESGILLNSNAKRYNLRANADFEIGKYIKIGESVSLTRRVVQNSDNGAFSMALESSPLSRVYNEYNKEGYEGHQVTYAYLADTAPINPVLAIPREVYDENPGSYPVTDTIYDVPNTGGNDKFNPLASIAVPQNYAYRNNVLANVYVEVNPFDWLSFRSTPSIYARFNQDKDWRKAYDAGVRSRPNAELRHNFNEAWTTAIENKLVIQKDFGDHNISLLGVHHFRNGYNDNTAITASGFEYEQLNVVGQSEERTARGGHGNWAELSYIGRLMYDYKSKYLLTASIRRDGSSNFGDDRRFGTFPAFSIAWKINQDLFPAFEPIDLMKIRAGWGQTGNSDVGGSFKYQTLLTSPDNFRPVFGEDQTIAMAMNEFNSIGNPLIKWEAADMYNVGIDMNALNNKIQLSAEYYLKRQNDLLLDVPVPAVLGRHSNANPAMNIGKVQNQGLEFDLRYSKMEGEFNYNVSANLSTVKNEVVSIPDPIRSGGHITMIGHTIGSYFGYVDMGIIQESDFEEVTELEDGTKQYSGYKYAIPTEAVPSPGDIRFKDLNRDGEISDADRTIIGKPVPDFTYTLSLELYYKDFDFSLFLFGMQNYQIVNSQRISMECFHVQDMDHNKSADWATNYWTPENQSTEYVRADLNNTNQNTRTSTWWVEDGSFLRVKDAQLGYTLPQKALNYLNLQKIRLYISAVNLYTFTTYKGRDPESPISGSNVISNGFDGSAYPLPRVFNVGVQIDF